MNEDAKWLFSCGTSHSHASFGFCAGSDPDPNRVEAAAKVLGRLHRFVDDEDYQLEMFAAALNGQTGAVAYVESRAKELKELIDVNFYVHVRGPDGREVKWEVKSYNPILFGTRFAHFTKPHRGGIALAEQHA